MEKDDKLIRKMLEKGLLTKAPENFTDKVMMAVAAAEIQRKPVIDFSAISYVFIVLGAFIVSAGVLYFTNNELLVKYYTYFMSSIAGVTAFISGIFANFNLSFSNIPGSGLIAGISLIMIALLAFDRYVFSGRRYVNLFV